MLTVNHFSNARQRVCLNPTQLRARLSYYSEHTMSKILSNNKNNIKKSLQLKRSTPKPKPQHKAPKRHTLTKTIIKHSKPHLSKEGGFFTKAGHAIGSLFGAPGIGRAAGSLLGSITGMGDYKYTPGSNSLTSVNGAPPSFDAMETIRLRRTEYLMDIRASDEFKVHAEIYINPGNADFAPVGKNIANLYTQYELKGCVFEFRATSSVSSTDPVVGTVLMATQPDLYEPEFTSKQQMEMHSQRSVDKPSTTFLHGVECDPRDRVTRAQYIRGESVPVGADPLLFDWGRFTIATAGQGSSYDVSTTPKIIGELWVSYDIVLKVPVLTPPEDATLQASHFVNSPANTSSSANPGGTAGYVQSGGGTLTTVTVDNTASPGVNLPNVGNYYIMYHISATNNSNDMPTPGPVILGANLAESTVFVQSGSQYSAPNIATLLATAEIGSLIEVIVCIRCSVLTPGTGATNRLSLPSLTHFGGGAFTGNTEVYVSKLPQSLQLVKKAAKPTSVAMQLVELQDQLKALSGLVHKSVTVDTDFEDEKECYVDTLPGTPDLSQSTIAAVRAVYAKIAPKG